MLPADQPGDRPTPITVTPRTCVVRVTDGTLVYAVDNGLAIVPPGPRGPQMLNPTAALLWNALNGGPLGDVLADCFPDVAPERAMTDVIALVEALLAVGLAQIVDPPPEGPHV